MFTFSVCGSVKTLEFLGWLGVDVPRWIQNDLRHADDTLQTSYQQSLGAAGELIGYCRRMGVPFGVNVESVSIRLAEIQASVDLAQQLDRELRPDQPGRHAEQRREHSHRTRTRLLCTAFPPPPRDDQDARVRRSLRGGDWHEKIQTHRRCAELLGQAERVARALLAPRRRLDDPADPAASSRLVLVKVLPRSAVCLPAESVTVRRALSAGRRRGRCGS